MGNCKSSEAAVQATRVAYGNGEPTDPIAFGDFGELMSMVSSTSGGLDEVVRRVHEAETEKLLGPLPASKETIELLPQLKVNQAKTLSRNDEHVCCAVCLSAFEEEAIIKELPCGHCFHVKCADEWLQRRCTCPICRTKLRRDSKIEKENSA